jgi:putative ABC transport system permease protein
MFAYYLRLAVGSFRRNPGLTALMVLAVALGIAVCLITLTGYRAAANNPIPEKNDVLFSPAVDGWDPNNPYDKDKPWKQPDILTYRDAVALTTTGIPDKNVIMVKTADVISREDGGMEPEGILVRATSADFFSMFQVPFKYGGGWDKKADAGPDPVIVLSKAMNERAFKGENSVGRSVRWHDRDFRVVGVLDEWTPAPKYYDVSNGSFDDPENAYIPFAFDKLFELGAAGNTNCWKTETIDSFERFTQSECIWIEAWVELPTPAKVRAYREWMDNYVTAQKKLGRFPRPLNNGLYNVDEWLKFNNVVGDDRKAMVLLAFAFLAVCLINTVGLLLAKFMNAAPIAGVRRALGASRRDVFWQHLVEAGVVSVAGGIVGTLLGLAGLWALRAWYGRFMEQFGRTLPFEYGTLALAIAISLAAGLLAGLYPAWRIGRAPPASYLKVQ